MTKVHCKRCGKEFDNWGAYASHACKRVEPATPRSRPLAREVPAPVQAPRAPSTEIPGVIPGDLRIITINLAGPHVKALKLLQDLRVYPSRSEAIRVAVRDFLIKMHQPGRKDARYSPDVDPPVVDPPVPRVDAGRVARMITALEAEAEVTA